MAKSLRASSKVKARNARRYNPNTDYAVTQAARLHAISQRLAARVKGPSVTEETRQSSDDNEEKQEVDAEEESKGWCLCFERGFRKGKEIDKREICRESLNEATTAMSSTAHDILIDVQLLGLVDADTIGLSDRGLHQIERLASPVDWMFRDSNLLELATDR